MFNPNELAAWSEHLLRDPLSKVFDGHNTESLLVRTPTQCAELRTDKGRLYAPERIFGVPIDPNCLSGVGNYEIALATPTLSRNPNARVVGFCAILTEDQRLLAPHEINDSTKFDFISHNKYNHQGFLFNDDPAGLHIRFSSRSPARHIPGTAIFLHNIEPGNYGSFIFRQLPQMMIAAQLATEVNYYVVADRTPWLREAINLSGLPSRPIFTVREVCGDFFDEIIMISGVDNGGFLSHSTRLHLLDFANNGRTQSSSPLHPGWVYVSRLLSAHDRPWYRVMLNEREVEASLRRRGFSVVYPETLSITEQNNLFSSASVIVGPSGSGMFNAIFASQHCRILDIETYHVTVAQHAMFYASMGKRYSFLFQGDTSTAPPYSINQAYNVDIELLHHAVDWCLT